MAAVAVAGLGAVATPAHAEWMEATSAHFTVYANLSESSLRNRITRLERFDAALRGMVGAKGEGKTTIYVTHGTEDIKRMAGSDSVLGFYNGAAAGATAFIPDNLDPNYRGITPEQVMFHEYTHHLLLSSENAIYPGWMTEGLAELFSAMKLREDGSVVVGGLPVENRVASLMSSSRWTVRRLLASDQQRPSEDEKIELYSRGWLLCHYLLISGKRQGQFLAYVNALNRGQPALEAGEAVFGDLHKLDGELETYLHRGTLPAIIFGADKVNASAQVSLRQLTPGEAAIMPYRMESAHGVNRATAAPLAAKGHAAGDRFAQDAFVQNALAEMDFDARDYDRADAEAAHALTLAPTDARAMIYRGRVAGMRARKAQGEAAVALWKEARGWFLKANRQDPNAALPFVLFYDSFLAAGQPVPDGAKTGLRRAGVLAPSDNDLRLRLAMMFIRDGDIPFARTLLAPLSTDPHGKQDNPVTTLVQAIDGGADKAALIAKMHEMKLDPANEFASDEDKPKEAGKPSA